MRLKISDTQTVGHSHYIKLDANGNLRLKDLIEFVANKIIDYAIPKKEIDLARGSSSIRKAPCPSSCDEEKTLITSFIPSFLPPLEFGRPDLVSGKIAFM